MSPYVESQRDALSAVKLDPAVLEAQVTINTQAPAVESEDCGEELATITEETTAAAPPPDFKTMVRQQEAALLSLTPDKLDLLMSFADAMRRRRNLNYKMMMMDMQQEAALLSLTPDKLDFLMSFADAMRRRRNLIHKMMECSFCKNNGERVDWYSSHCLKDGRGRVRCPVLRAFRCPRCGATGDHAHTIKYCPENILSDADYWSQGGGSP